MFAQRRVSGKERNSVSCICIHALACVPSILCCCRWSVPFRGVQTGEDGLGEADGGTLAEVRPKELITASKCAISGSTSAP